jgi:hypothetical protein
MPLKCLVLTLITVDQTADRLASPHVGLGQVQLDLATGPCVHIVNRGEIQMYGWACLRQKKNHSTQDSHVVPHQGTSWAALWLTSQIRRDAVLSKSYGRG